MTIQGVLNGSPRGLLAPALLLAVLIGGGHPARAQPAPVDEPVAEAPEAPTAPEAPEAPEAPSGPTVADVYPSWRIAISQRMSVSPESLILNLPPAQKPLLGAVIIYHGKSATFEIIGHLNPKHYRTVANPHKITQGVQGSWSLPADSDVIAAFFKKTALADDRERVNMLLVAHHLTARHLFVSDSAAAESDLDNIFRKWKDAHPAKTDASRYDEPIIVNAVYRSTLELAFHGLDPLRCEVADDYELVEDQGGADQPAASVPPVADDIIKLHSRKLVVFAFSGKTVFDLRKPSEALAPPVPDYDVAPAPDPRGQLKSPPTSKDAGGLRGVTPNKSYSPNAYGPYGAAANNRLRVDSHSRYHSADIHRHHRVQVEEYKRPDVIMERKLSDSLKNQLDEAGVVSGAIAMKPPNAPMDDAPLPKADPLDPAGPANDSASVPDEAASPAEKPIPPTVTVNYATCRQSRAEDTPWLTHAGRFFLKTNGILTVLVCIVLAQGFWLALGFMKALTFKRCLLTICLMSLVCVGAAAVDATSASYEEKSVTGVYNNYRGELSYGVAEVTVPEKHQRGKFERELSVYVFRGKADPTKHFTVKLVTPDQDRFLRNLKTMVDKSSKKDAFVFIHGYNVTFADAIRRTAQLHLDLEFEGAPICFSWPSQAELIHYLTDDTTAQVAADRLQELLLELEKKSGAERIHLIAHSMGNKVLGLALKKIGVDHLANTSVFDTIILTAPDIDVEVFETQILPAMQRKERHITLYASKADLALTASATLRSYRRLGDASELFCHDSMESIDVSSIEADFLGHSYFGDHPLVIADMAQVLGGVRATKRQLQADKSPSGAPFWLIRP